MEEKIEKINIAIKQAAASIWLDNLPLSEEYVENYRIKRINEIKNSKRLVLKRGIGNDKRK